MPEELTPKQVKFVRDYAARLHAKAAAKNRAIFDATERENPSRDLQERITRRLAMAQVGDKLPKLKSGYEHVSGDPFWSEDV